MNRQSWSGIRFAGGFNVHDELHCAKALAAVTKTKHTAVISIFISISSMYKWREGKKDHSVPGQLAAAYFLAPHQL